MLRDEHRDHRLAAAPPRPDSHPQTVAGSSGSSGSSVEADLVGAVGALGFVLSADRRSFAEVSGALELLLDDGRFEPLDVAQLVSGADWDAVRDAFDSLLPGGRVAVDVTLSSGATRAVLVASGGADGVVRGLVVPVPRMVRRSADGVREEKAVALARTLQASLLPPRAPQVPGMEVAARFSAADRTDAVSGDFYDVFRLRSNDWGIVIGDVCGKGADAAALTAMARYTLRAAAVHDLPPAAVLRELNDALCADPTTGERFATAVFARLELDRCGAWVTLSCGGHPQPVVTRRAGWIDVRGVPGTLLGAFPSVDLADDRLGLGPADAVVFFTDGVLDSTSPDGERFGEDRLRSVLLDGCGAPAEAQAQAVLDAVESFAHGALSDDVAVLVVRVPDDAREDPDGRLARALATMAVAPSVTDVTSAPAAWARDLDWVRPESPVPARPDRAYGRLRCEPTAPQEARAMVEGMLRSWRLGDDVVDAAKLVIDELATNALRHARSAAAVRLEHRGDVVRICVRDDSARPPRLLSPPPEATSGRGMLLVDRVSAAWGWEATSEDGDGGKVVWCDLPVSGGLVDSDAHCL